MAAQEMLKRMQARKEFISYAKEVIKDHYSFNKDEYLKLNRKADEIAAQITDKTIDFDEAQLIANQFVINLIEYSPKK